MGFSKLKNIDLAHNHIFQLPGLHDVQDTLERMGAYQNGILSLDAFQTHAYFKMLSYIRMACNNIRTFDITLLRHMTPQQLVRDLYGNKLTRVDGFRRNQVKFIELWHYTVTWHYLGWTKKTRPLKNTWLVRPRVVFTGWPLQTWVNRTPWWRHQMETFSALLAIFAWNSPVFDLRLNKRLSKQ